MMWITGARKDACGPVHGNGSTQGACGPMHRTGARKDGCGVGTEKTAECAGAHFLVILKSPFRLS